MKFTPTKISDVWEITPEIHGDARGYFVETWKKEEFKSATGLDPQWVQQNQSKSCQGVLRGLHYQTGEHAQAKLAQVITGSVVDVVLDLRQSSPTFGQSIAVELNEDNKKQLFMPRGVAHGFLVKSETAIFTYMVDNFYLPEFEYGVNWADDSLGIEWGIDEEIKSKLLLADRDINWPKLADIEQSKLFN